MSKFNNAEFENVASPKIINKLQLLHIIIRKNSSTNLHFDLIA